MIRTSDSGLTGLSRALPPVVVAVAAALLALSPAQAAPLTPGKTPAKSRLTMDAPTLSPFQAEVSDPTNFSFTVPGSGGATARAQTVERAFRFTPSGQTDNRKALSLGVSTRVAAPAPERNRTLAAAEPMVLTPRAYNVDVSVGWKGFALNTGFSHSESAARPGLITNERDTLDIGLSYGGKNWRTSLQGTAEERSILAFSPLERRYSLALGGAYMVAPRLSVSGGVRYRLPTETPSLIDMDRADQSVYVGTNIAF